MERLTLSELDYYRIRDEIAERCVSDEGREALASREPFSAQAEYEHLKDLSREWESAFCSQKKISLNAWPRVAELFQFLRANGTSLGVQDFYALLVFSKSVRCIIEEIASSETELNLQKLSSLAKELPDLSDAENEMSKVMDKNGALKDLKELREIKEAIQKIRAEIESVFKNIISSNAVSALESTLPVVRGERQLLAVKSGERARIKGIIHEVSNSGRTVFIEPEEVVRLNNDLVQKEFELEAAVRKILTELTARLSEHRESFERALEKMVLLDTTAAAARWGIENECVYAQSCSSHDQSVPPLLLKARHPLLRDKAVPIDISFLSGKRVLIITGPNTGGKTVAIKTFALFSMLNQSGFPLPAAEGTRLPCFKNVFADIGDGQSLDESLSTFSAHMKKIAAAVNGADKDSLILLDELGSGTDPTEGSAIALAVLDSLIERGSFVLVTTHHGILKNFGYTNPVCLNASVEFDAASLKPAYRIIMGVPGESRALEIAENSGLDKKIVMRARGYIQNEQADISALISGLNKKHSELDRRLRETESMQSAVEERALKNEQKEIRLRRREHDLKAQASKNESAFLRDARRRLEKLVRELKEGEITREKTLAVKEFKESLEAAEKIHSEILEAEEKNLLSDEEKFEVRINSHKSNKIKKGRVKNSEALKNATPTLPLRAERKQKEPAWKEGARVFSKMTGREGFLVRKEKDGVWSVQFGSIKINAAEKELRLAEAQDIARPPLWQYTPPDEKQSESPAYELRLLGLRADEALAALQKQIDLCVIRGLKNFSVIHGKGTGVLQEAVHEYLKTCPAVQDFHFAGADEGGFGKTYVALND